METKKARAVVLRFTWILAGMAAAAALPGAQGAIFVDPLIATTSCANYNPSSRSCGSGSETAYRTIEEAAAATTPGSLVLLRAGNYHEPLRPPNSGTTDLPITFQRYQTEAVLIEGTNWTSDPGIGLYGVSNIVVDGLIVSNVIGWVAVEGASWNTLRNCSFLLALAPGGRGGVKLVGSHHNQIANNRLDDGWLNLSLIDSDFNVVVGNTFRRGAYALWNIRCGNFNVIRGNSFSNGLQQIGQITDCSGWPSGTPFKTNATKFNLIEGNSFEFTPSSGPPSPYSGLQCSGQKEIIRRNRFYGTAGAALELTHSPIFLLGTLITNELARYVTDSRVYQNVFYGTRFAGVQLAEPKTNAFSGHVFKNNIFSQSVFAASDTRWPWYTNELTGKPVQILSGRLNGYVFDGNDILGTAPNQLYAITYGLQSSTSNGPQQTLTWWQQAHPELFSNNLETPPQFVNPAGGDFKLTIGSPLIDAGVFLTRTTAAGSGTTLSVEDAAYFYNGFGMPWELGDVIQLQGQTDVARIVHIDYTNNLLMVSQPLTWTVGQGVALRFNGSAPDVGAFNYPDTPPQLTLVEQPQSQQTTLGTNISFTIGFLSSELAVFRWQKDGRNISDDARISGAGTCCLTISNIQASDAGGYRVLLTSEAGSVTSQVAILSLPFPTDMLQFSLQPTYNLLSIPFTGTDYINAERLALSVPGCLAVWSWNPTNQAWLSHPKGGPNNFTVIPASAYLVAVNGTGTFQVSGAWASRTNFLRRGYNFITLPPTLTTLTNAERLALSVPNCSLVSELKSTTQSWSSHPKGGPNNFQVEPGRPYLIYVSTNGAWPLGL